MNQLEKFQKNNGLIADGILGARTLSKMKEVFGISRDTYIAHFAGQVSHETSRFKYEEENLNYSAEGLMRVFSSYFTNEQALQYAYKPEKIANRVYANRMGNGDELSGDGWKYRGRGAIQLTGKNNYELFANKMRDMNIYCKPDLVNDKYFFQSAIYYFNHNNLWRFCDNVNNHAIKEITKRINGGYNGLKDRIQLTNKYYKILCS